MINTLINIPSIYMMWASWGCGRQIFSKRYAANIAAEAIEQWLEPCCQLCGRQIYEDGGYCYFCEFPELDEND